MSTRLEPLIYQERCSRQSLSSPCSNLKHLSFSKRRKKKILSWKVPSRTWTQECLQPRIQRWSGKKFSGTPKEDAKKAKNVVSVRRSKLSLLQQESRHRLYLVPIVTCLRISRSLAPMVCLPHTNHQNQVHRCATSLNPFLRISSTDPPYKVSLIIYKAYLI